MHLIIQNSRFRLLWASVAINYIGLMFYFTVHGWLALTVTDSAFWVGATSGMNGLGLVSLSLLAGVLVDRLNRKRLLLTAQLSQSVLAFVVAILLFTGQIRLWQVMLVAFLDGTLMAVKIPSHFALVLDVAGRENTLRATAANFVAMTAMGIAVPPLAGLVVDTLSMGWAYVAMGSAFVLSTLLLVFLQEVERAIRENRTSPLQELKEGIRYVLATPAVRALILMSLTSEAFGWAHETMLPVMAGKVLHAGPTGLGYLISAGSGGALVSTFILSNRRDVQHKERLLVGGYLGFGAFLILFALSSWLPLSLVLIALAYAMVAMYETTLSTLLQTTVPDEMRGRVLSFQAFTWGVTGSSGFYTGIIAMLLGTPVAIAMGGGVLVLNGLRMVRRSKRFHKLQAE
ncbi:Enterobactin exporter EntS [Candidatus Entotheonellaceae bacterium PAL068K]